MALADKSTPQRFCGKWPTNEAEEYLAYPGSCDTCKHPKSSTFQQTPKKASKVPGERHRLQAVRIGQLTLLQLLHVQLPPFATEVGHGKVSRLAEAPLAAVQETGKDFGFVSCFCCRSLGLFGLSRVAARTAQQRLLVARAGRREV